MAPGAFSDEPLSSPFPAPRKPRFLGWGPIVKAGSAHLRVDVSLSTPVHHLAPFSAAGFTSPSLTLSVLLPLYEGPVTECCPPGWRG